MATIIKKPTIQPEKVFDRLHVDTFTLTQTRPVNGYHPIKRGVRIQGTTYAQDEDGSLEMNPKSLSCSINDLDMVIVDNYCQTKGKVLSEVPADLMAARASMINKYSSGEITDLDLMAAFELALGRILELSGSIEIDRIE